jgi:hypothetical protein
MEGRIEAETAHPRGDPELPLSSAEIESKFEALAAYGGREGGRAASRLGPLDLGEPSPADSEDLLAAEVPLGALDGGRSFHG